MSGQVFVDITMSLDGFITGPNDTVEAPLGEGGERPHQWGYDLELAPAPTASRAAEPVPTTT